MAVIEEFYGRLEDGDVHRFTLTNGAGSMARVITYGARLVEMRVAGRDGRPADVALGYGRLEGYLADRDGYLGATIGRYANRIRGGRFVLDGNAYRLARNEPPHHQHGGVRGFDSVVWNGVADPAGNAVFMSRRSGDGEEGFPGALDVRVVYRLTEANELAIEMTATTTKPTVVNLAHHSYWNLAGEGTGDVLDHVLEVAADAYTPTDAALIPTGEIAPIAGTPLDFTAAQPIGRDIARVFGPVGYDHNFVLHGTAGTLRRAARLVDPASGRELELLTDEVGLQVYTAGHMNGMHLGKSGRPYGRFAGVALETQKFPDAPNRPNFPSARLDPGETYRHVVLLRFSVPSADEPAA